MNHLYDPTRPFEPHAQALPQAPNSKRGVPVSFELKRAGVTEIVTTDGVRIELRIKVNSMHRVGTDDNGLPVYDAEFVVEPTNSLVMNTNIRAIGELVS